MIKTLNTVVATVGCIASVSSLTSFTFEIAMYMIYNHIMGCVFMVKGMTLGGTRMYGGGATCQTASHPPVCVVTGRWCLPTAMINAMGHLSKSYEHTSFLVYSFFSIHNCDCYFPDLCPLHVQYLIIFIQSDHPRI